MENKMRAEGFINECKISPIFKISKTDITKELLDKIGLKPRYDGFYYRSQMLELKNLLMGEQKTLKDIWRLPDEDILVLDTMLENKSTTQNVQAQNFLLLLLAPKFQSFVKETRELFGMPKNGFKNLKEKFSWIRKKAEELQEYEKNQKIISETTKDLEAYIMKCLWQTAEKECDRHNITVRYNNFPYKYLLVDYIFFDDPLFGYKNFKQFHSERAKMLPAQYSIQMTKNNQKNPQLGAFELHILIYRETTRDDAIETINKNWNVIKRWQKRLPLIPKHRKKLISNFHRDFIVYQFSQQGLNDIKIQQKIREKYGYDLELNHIRKIISDMKKRIKETWGS